MNADFGKIGTAFRFTNAGGEHRYAFIQSEIFNPWG